MVAPRTLTCVLALATLALGACTSGTPLTGGEPRARGVAGGGATGTTGGTGDPQSPDRSPAATPLTAEAYRSELTGRRDQVGDALTALVGAGTLKTLDQRVSRAQEALRAAADELAALSPPPEAQAPHQAYVAGLREVAGRLEAASAKVGSRDLCTSSAVLTDLGDALGTLDRAGEALRDAGDYPADVVTVKAPAKQNRRLGNGHFLRKGALNGRSSLQIHNGGTRDAVVNLTRGKTKVISVYVRRKAKFKIKGVRDGNYRIYFTHGVDWDGKKRAFSRECSFEQFQKPMKFKTTYTATQVLWHDWQITLHAISGGNAQTSPVDPDTFPGG